MRFDGPLRFAALLAFEVSAVIGLQRLGRFSDLRIDWTDLGGWLTLAAPEDALVALCRVAALACALWLLAGTLLYGLAVVLRVPAAVRAAGWLTLPLVRRVVDRALATTLVGTGVLAGPTLPAVAVETQAAATRVPAGFAAPAPLPVPLYRPVPAGDPPPRQPVAHPHPHPDPATPETLSSGQPGTEPRSNDARRVVSAGDDLWNIAVERVGNDDRARLVAYWGALIELNRSHLRSGDPDLIYPGEVLQLPPLP